MKTVSSERRNTRTMYHSGKGNNYNNGIPYYDITKMNDTEQT